MYRKTSGGEDFALAGNRLRAGADYDINAGLGIGIAGLADGRNAPVLEANVGFDNAGIIDDQCIGDDGVDGAVGARNLRLTHAVADDLAAAELHLLAVSSEILLHLDEKFGIDEPHLVANGRAEHVGISGAGERCEHVSST